MSKQVQVSVKFDGHDWNNTFTMTSPTGRSVTVHCNGRWRRMTKTFLDMVNSLQYAYVEDYTWGTWKKILVSTDVMREALELSGN